MRRDRPGAGASKRSGAALSHACAMVHEEQLALASIVNRRRNFAPALPFWLVAACVQDTHDRFIDTLAEVVALPFVWRFDLLLHLGSSQALQFPLFNDDRPSESGGAFCSVLFLPRAFAVGLVHVVMLFLWQVPPRGQQTRLI